MQISTNEMIKLLAETERFITEKITAKVREEEKKRISNTKKYLPIIEIVYEWCDIDANSSTLSYNTMVSDGIHMNLVNELMKKVKDILCKTSPEKIYELEYNPQLLEFDFYTYETDGVKTERKLVYVARNIRDVLIDRYEV